MASVSQEIPKQNHVIFSPLQQPEFLAKLKNWLEILSSCYGPFGNSVCVQNVHGGPSSMVRHSKQLLELVKPSNPILQVVASCVKSHNTVWKDFGLFSSMMILHVLQSALKSSMPLPLVANAFEFLGNIVLNHLASECTRCQLKGDVTNLIHLKSVVDTILQSKLYHLPAFDIDYLTTVILQSFLFSVPNEMQTSATGLIVFVLRDGLALKASQFYPGYLCSLNSYEYHSQHTLPRHGKIALFEISLAGDYENNTLGVEFESCDSALIEAFVLDKITGLIDDLIELKVSIVASQKVVHPSIKKKLKRHNVLLVERLGTEGLKSLQHITGATPISTLFQKSDLSTIIGTVKEVSLIEFYEKSYLLFKGNYDCIGTIVLCGSGNDILEELKTSCEQALHALNLMLSNPVVFVGAGCLESHLMLILHRDVSSKNLSSALGVSNGQVNAVLQLLMDSLKFGIRNLYPKEKDFWADLSSGHLFLSKGNSQHCACGLLHCDEKNLFSLGCFGDCDEKLDTRILKLSKEKKQFLDLSVMKLSAYRTVLNIIPVLLRISTCVIDCN